MLFYLLKMKKYTLLLVLGILGACNKNSENNTNLDTKTIWVRGNCEMCQERIETKLKNLKHVSQAHWDVNTSMLKVTFDSTQTSILSIEKFVAETGHATKNVASEPSVIAELPDCCKPQ